MRLPRHRHSSGVSDSPIQPLLNHRAKTSVLNVARMVGGVALVAAGAHAEFHQEHDNP